MRTTSSDDKILPIYQINKKLRLVVIDCPYDTIRKDPRTEQLFGRMVRFKIDSYLHEYPYGILPVDSVDFFCTHYLVCEETSNGLEPIMGFKTTTLDRCKIFHTQFPAFHILEGQDLPNYRQAIDDIIKRAVQLGKIVGYIGSWTFRFDMRQDKQIVKLCYDLSVALFVHACERFKLSTLVTFASLRFKVDELHKFIGLEPLRLEGQLLEPFLCKPFFDEKSVGSVLHVENFSLAARDLASRYKFFWDDRIEILEQLSENEKKAA